MALLAVVVAAVVIGRARWCGGDERPGEDRHDPDRRQSRRTGRRRGQRVGRQRGRRDARADRSGLQEGGGQARAGRRDAPVRRVRRGLGVGHRRARLPRRPCGRAHGPPHQDDDRRASSRPVSPWRRVPSGWPMRTRATCGASTPRPTRSSVARSRSAWRPRPWPSARARVWVANSGGRNGLAHRPQQQPCRRHDPGRQRTDGHRGRGGGSVGHATPATRPWCASIRPRTGFQVSRSSSTANRAGWRSGAVPYGSQTTATASCSGSIPATGDITDTVEVGNHPSAVAVGEGAVWVAVAEDGTVVRVEP